MKDAIEDTKFWDKLGICGSTLCLIHCILPPILMVFLPLNQSALFEIEFIHDILSIVVIGSVLIALYPSCKKHEHFDIIGYAALGILFIVGAGFTYHFSITTHTILTSIGSIFLIIAHVRNIRIRHGNCKEKTSCSHT